MPQPSSAGELYLALDQGGHASRALLFDRAGRVVGRGLREVGERRPRPGRVEQDPEELVSSLREAVEEALRDLPSSQAGVRAGMATQRASIVCWDRESGRALSPVLSWQDRRTHDWLRQFESRASEIHERTGLYLSAHYGAGKLRWCLDHLSEVRTARASGRLVCGPLASFLMFRLLEGQPLRADPVNAARTLLWNLRRLDWDDELLAMFGVPRELLPRCGPTRQQFGLLPTARGRLPFSILNGDQSAALFAHGTPDPRAAYVNLGTGAFAQRVVERIPRPLPGLLGGVVHSERSRAVYVIEGTVNGAGSALRKLSGELGIDEHERRLGAWLQEPLRPPLFLNGVSGLGAPYWVADFPSVFVGRGEPREKLVAVAESIVFLLAVNLRVIASLAGPLDRIVASGGVASWDGLCQRLSDLSGLPVERPGEREATARGTAFLVAGCPQTWPAGGVEARFTPRENRPLRLRFERWERELEARLP